MLSRRDVQVDYVSAGEARKTSVRIITMIVFFFLPPPLYQNAAWFRQLSLVLPCLHYIPIWNAKRYMEPLSRTSLALIWLIQHNSQHTTLLITTDEDCEVTFIIIDTKTVMVGGESLSNAELAVPVILKENNISVTSGKNLVVMITIFIWNIFWTLRIIWDCGQKKSYWYKGAKQLPPPSSFLFRSSLVAPVMVWMIYSLQGDGRSASCVERERKGERELWWRILSRRNYSNENEFRLAVWLRMTAPEMSSFVFPFSILYFGV